MSSIFSSELNIFTDGTKTICNCTAASIIIILLFVLSPLSNFFKTTIFMKLLSIVILVYTMYLNLIQTNYLRNASNSTKAENVKSQLTINIFCSYIFTLFLGLLAIFVIKSFF
jgi:hypothetical protein